MQRYLLPCSCGKTVPVGISQAGFDVTCECGKSLEVPNIRRLKALPTETTAAPAAAPKPAQEIHGINVKGLAFVLGFLLFVAGCGMSGWYYYVHSQLQEYTEDRTADEEAFVAERIESLGVDDMYRTWQMIEKQGLGDYEAPVYMVARRDAHFAMRMVFSGAMIAVAGIALCVYGVVGGSSVRRST